MLKSSTISDFELKSYLLLFFCICVFPFVYLARYNLPLSDEFTAMHFVSKIGFWSYQEDLFTKWSGRYTANLLEIIYPLKINPVFYISATIITLFVLYCSIYFVLKKITDKKNTILFTCFLLVFFLNYSPSIGDLIYYVPAIIIYTVSIILSLLYIRLFLSDIRLTYKYLLFILLNILLLGTSELFIPVIAFTSFLFILKTIKQKLGIGVAILNLIIVLGIIIFLIHSKGNNNRFDEQGNKFDLIFGIKNYTFELLYWTKKFILMSPVLILMLLLLSLKKLPGSFFVNYNNSLFFYLIAVYVLAFTPLFLLKLNAYKRIGNIFFFLFSILSVTMLLKYLPNIKINAIYQRILLFLITIIILFSGNIKAAYEDIYFGYTKNYSDALIDRYNFLESNRNKKHLEISNIPITKYINNIQDVNDKPTNNLVNDMYERYYNIDSISIR